MERVNTGGLTEIHYPRGYEVRDSEEGMRETRQAYARARERQRKERKRNLLIILIIVAVLVIVSKIMFR